MTVSAAATGFVEAAEPAAAADSPTAEYEKPNVGVPDSSLGQGGRSPSWRSSPVQVAAI